MEALITLLVVGGKLVATFLEKEYQVRTLFVRVQGYTTWSPTDMEIDWSEFVEEGVICTIRDIGGFLGVGATTLVPYIVADQLLGFDVVAAEHGIWTGGGAVEFNTAELVGTGYQLLTLEEYRETWSEVKNQDHVIRWAAARSIAREGLEETAIRLLSYTR